MPDIDYNLFGNMKSCPERMPLEQALREKNAENKLSFGVPFLDDALDGIYANDLILLGAKTGCGKSQLAMLAALHNAKMGKRIHIFALEAEEYEIERRIKYQMISEVFFALEKSQRPRIMLNYNDWYYGKLSKELAFIEDDISKSGFFPTLKTYYRTGDFTGEEFERLFLGIKDETDLVIIDHLHYFDFDDQNENRAIKSIIKKIRDCALLAGKPIMLIAHIRKSEKKSKQLIPDIEDFHGSSDIGKIATKAITIGPCPVADDQNPKDPRRRETYMQILKHRVDGSRMYATAKTAFHLQKQTYETEYLVGRLNFVGDAFTPSIKEETPFWAKNAQNGKLQKIEKVI